MKEIVYLIETDSTNNLMKAKYLGEADGFTLYTGYQSAGRGQAGNGWESERDKNLLFTTLMQHPEVEVTRAFDLNVRISVALWRTVAPLVPEPEKLTIKWPNDLYYGDRKLAGILVETGISSRGIDWAIAGVGLNLNQIEWVGNAPNPISLHMITGKEYDMHEVMRAFMAQLAKTDYDRVPYMAHLYRREGLWPYVERAVTIDPTNIVTASSKGEFVAQIEGITPEGCLVLKREDGQTKSYHFKQVRFVV